MQGIFMFAVAPPKGVSNHTVEIDKDGNGAKPALDRVRTRSLKSRRVHRPNAIAESANSHRSVLVWPTDAPNKGAQRAPVAPTAAPNQGPARRTGFIDRMCLVGT
jgi:hypothetical protein